ncbi:hypothetical protein Tco_0921257 [Tanacetum coccineum]
MSNSEHSTMSYTSISLDSDPSTWGIPLMDAGKVPEMDPYEELAYSEYLVPSDDEIPIEDQPLPDDASPLALSPGYIVDSDLEEDEDDLDDYPADGRDDDDDDESFDDDDDDDDDV